MYDPAVLSSEENATAHLSPCAQTPDTRKRNRPERWKATWSLLLRQGGKPRKSRAARHLRQLASQTGRRRPPQPGSHLRQQCRNPTQTTRTKPRPLSRHRRPAWQSRNTRLLRSSWERHHRTPETSYGRLCPASAQRPHFPPFGIPNLKAPVIGKHLGGLAHQRRTPHHAIRIARTVLGFVVSKRVVGQLLQRLYASSFKRAAAYEATSSASSECEPNTVFPSRGNEPMSE